MDTADMKSRFERVIADPTSGSNVVDLELRKIVSILGLSVLKLDASSTFLAWVNIGLGVIVILIGILQVVIMLRGH